MKGSVPTIHCDDESGCTEWTLDYYEMTCDNWRSLMDKGWQFDPYDRNLPHLCPDHAAAPTSERGA
jgi:hypothetical protein